jgi:hypothetical protein
MAERLTAPTDRTSATHRTSALAVRPRRRFSVNALLDNLFFIVAFIAAVWLAYLVLTEGFKSGWAQVWFYLLFWLILAYLVLPRLHRILTNIYVPNYFIGRTRTSDGLLGDPVNLALLGSEAQVHAALQGAGWTRADDLSLLSGWKIVASTILRRSYDEAPVSPLMLFGRNQDFAYQQEVHGNPAKRHHVRFWYCPDDWLLPGGHHVDWLAAGTFDRAVGFSLFTLQITHKIDENTDIERDHIVKTVTDADPLATVDVLKDFATGYHSRNGGGDTIVTDGDLPIIDVSDVLETERAIAETVVPVPTPDSSGQDTGAPDKKVRRPSQIIFGAAVTFLRALTPLLLVLGVLLDWSGARDLIQVNDGTSLPATLDELDSALWVLIAGSAVVFVVDLVLAVFVYLGSNVARIAAMAFSTITVLFAAINTVASGAEITLGTNLISLSLDILILLALSGGRARDYARRPRDRKASRLAVEPSGIRPTLEA